MKKQQQFLRNISYTLDIIVILIAYLIAKKFNYSIDLQPINVINNCLRISLKLRYSCISDSYIISLYKKETISNKIFSIPVLNNKNFNIYWTKLEKGLYYLKIDKTNDCDLYGSVSFSNNLF